MLLSGIMLTLSLMQSAPAIQPVVYTSQEDLYEVSVSVMNYDTTLEAEYVEYCEQIGHEYNIAPALLIAIIEAESQGNPNAVATSGSGAVGLCQIKPQFVYERCEKLGITSLYNPKNNITVCADCLLELFEKYEDVCLVMTAYRYGENSQEFQYAQTTGYIYPYVKKVVARSDYMQMEADVYGK